MPRFGRTPPRDYESRERYERIIQDDADRRIAKLESEEDAEITMTSAGIGKEIRVSNNLDFMPNRFQVVNSDDAFSVGKSRGTLADENFIYLKSTAPYGTQFVVRVWRS
jgi:hypothetical protein